MKAPVAKDFITYSPTMGQKAYQPTEVRVLYNNNAIYIGAILFDDGEYETAFKYIKKA